MFYSFNYIRSILDYISLIVINDFGKYNPGRSEIFLGLLK